MGPPTGAGLAACLALLELEARALGRPLVALLIAAAGEALRAPAEQDAALPRPERPSESRPESRAAPAVSARAAPRRG